jgi:hypothetical protein
MCVCVPAMSALCDDACANACMRTCADDDDDRGIIVDDVRDTYCVCVFGIRMCVHVCVCVPTMSCVSPRRAHDRNACMRTLPCVCVCVWYVCVCVCVGVCVPAMAHWHPERANHDASAMGRLP